MGRHFATRHELLAAIQNLHRNCVRLVKFVELLEVPSNLSKEPSDNFGEDEELIHRRHGFLGESRGSRELLETYFLIPEFAQVLYSHQRSHWRGKTFLQRDEVGHKLLKWYGIRGKEVSHISTLVELSKPRRTTTRLQVM